MGAEAVSESEFEQASIQPLSRFDYTLAGPDALTLEGALSTIRKHHPGQRIWIEHSVG